MQKDIELCESLNTVVTMNIQLAFTIIHNVGFFPIDPNVTNIQAWNVRKFFVLLTPGQPKKMKAMQKGDEFTYADLFPTTIKCPKEHRYCGCGRFLNLINIVKINDMDCF